MTVILQHSSKYTESLPFETKQFENLISFVNICSHLGKKIGKKLVMKSVNQFFKTGISLGIKFMTA